MLGFFTLKIPNRPAEAFPALHATTLFIGAVVLSALVPGARRRQRSQ